MYLNQRNQYTSGDSEQMNLLKGVANNRGASSMNPDEELYLKFLKFKTGNE